MDLSQITSRDLAAEVMGEDKILAHRAVHNYYAQIARIVRTIEPYPFHFMLGVFAVAVVLAVAFGAVAAIVVLLAGMLFGIAETLYLYGKYSR